MLFVMHFCQFIHLRSVAKMNQQSMKSKPIVFLVIFGVLCVVGLWPTTYLASPQWKVLVVANNGQPLQSINVRLVYQNYSAEGQSHEITMQTDESGRVLFPPQYQKSTLFQRGFYTISSAIALAHASFGRHAYVFAFGRGYEGSALSGRFIADWRGNPDSMESKIVANGGD
jgi:hypothetical protein